jgi:methyl-accepting chemotaxis protein/CheY-like chemotaxis protein
MLDELRSRLDDSVVTGDPRVVVAGAGTVLGDRVAEHLEATGMPVAALSDAGVTDALADDDPVSVVVAPHDPPAVDGLALLEEVTAAGDVPVVVAAGSDDTATETAALDGGATDYVAVGDGSVLARRVAAAATHDLAASPPDPSAEGTASEFRDRVVDVVAAFNEVFDDLNGTGTFDEVARVVAGQAGEVLDFPGTSVRVYDEEAHALEVVSMGSTVEDIEERPPYPVEDSPHGEAWQRGETVVDDIGDDDPYDRDVFSQTMYVPIGEYGTLSAGIEEGVFSRLDRLFAELLARSARNAFEQAERRRQLAATALRVSEFADEVADAGAAVTAAAEQVRTASQEVTESVDDIASGAATQTGDLQSVLDELDDLLVTVDETVATADEVARQSEEAAELARQGTERADAGMGEMRRIEDRTEAMLADIRDLGEEIQRVSEIAELIEGVAEQTNILALNASIEAARAGEAGEGFAVVADEIKALAEETRESTDEIGEIVATVTERTDRTVDEMEEMQADIEDSVDTVADALSALEQIGEQVDETNDSIQEISDAVARQSTTLDETVEVAERVGAISEEVSSQTGDVAELVREQASALENVTDNAHQLEAKAGDLGALTEAFSLEEAVVEEAREEELSAATGGEPEAAAEAGDD